MKKVNQFLKFIKNYENSDPELVNTVTEGIQVIFENTSKINEMIDWSKAKLPDFTETIENARQLFALKRKVKFDLEKIKEEFPKFLYYNYSKDQFENFDKDLDTVIKENNPTLNDIELDDLALDYSSRFDFDDWMETIFGQENSDLINSEAQFESSSNMERDMESAVKAWTAHFFRRGFTKFWKDVADSKSNLNYGVPGWAGKAVEGGLERLEAKFPNHLYYDVQAGNCFASNNDIESILTQNYIKDGVSEDEIPNMVGNELSEYREIEFKDWKKIVLGELAQYV